MTSWDSGMPNRRLRRCVSQLAASSADPPQNDATEAAQGGGVTVTLTNLVKTQEFSPIFLGSAFLLSLLLGSLHALTPGHGKALVGAYLVGSQGRTRDAVFLGGIVTLTHTGSVVLLGLVTLFASHYILPALIAPWLEIISGVLVIGFGLNLLFRRGGDLVKWLQGSRTDAHDHDHDLGHSHSHDHTHPHDHSLPHTHASEPAARAQAGGQPLPQITSQIAACPGCQRRPVPCPDAIAILLVAVAVNRIPFGMLLILSFSIGLALVLIGIGVAMVNGVRLIARRKLSRDLLCMRRDQRRRGDRPKRGPYAERGQIVLRFGTQVVQSSCAHEPGL
jgi:ABC-type nickel/cobalt efflux system permease component RcnA